MQVTAIAAANTSRTAALRLVNAATPSVPAGAAPAEEPLARDDGDDSGPQLVLPTLTSAVPAASAELARTARAPGRHGPIVPTVLYFADQTQHYQLPTPQRLPVVYGTPQTVRLADLGAQLGDAWFQKTLAQTHVWCIPDDAAWSRLTAAHAALQEALNGLASALRQRGRYDHHLAAAGGFSAAPNPLSPTAVFTNDPDAPGGYVQELGAVPRLDRRPVAAHTPNMVRVALWENSWSLSAQHQCFVCPTDDDWQELAQAQAAVAAARASFDAIRDELGRYDVALADGRYAAPAAPPPAEELVIGPQHASPTPWPAQMVTEALLAHALAHVRSELAHVPATTWDQVRERIGRDTLNRTTQQLLESPLLTAASAEVLASMGDAPTPSASSEHVHG